MNELEVKEGGIVKKVEVGSRWPIYVWKAGKTFYLSKRQRCIAIGWIESQNYRYIQRKMAEEFGVSPSVWSIKKVLSFEFVREWIGEQMEERGLLEGWTKGRWLSILTDHLHGKKKLSSGDLYSMKLISGVMGWGDISGIMQVGEINFVQQNSIR